MRYLSFPILQKTKRQGSDPADTQIVTIGNSENIRFVAPNLQYEFSLPCTLSDDEKITERLRILKMNF